MAVTCDPKLLPAAATCFRCAEPGTLKQIELYLLGVLAKIPSPSALAAGAATYRPFTNKRALAVEVYLLSVLAKQSQTPSVLIKTAACWWCISVSERLNVETYLLAVAAGTSTDPKVLAKSMSPYRPLLTIFDQVRIYALNTVAGNLSTKALASGAECFMCLDHGRLEEIFLYLLCQWMMTTPVTPITPPTPAIPSTNLVLQLESSSFDASGNGSNINIWPDLSGNAHDFAYSADPWAGGHTFLHPTVDGATLLNGHKTAQFTIGADSSCLGSTNQFLKNAATGLTLMIIAKWLNSPPAPAAAPHGGAAASIHGQDAGNPNTHQPYQDGQFYENFASSARQTLGNPGVNLASGFHKYKIVADSVATSFKAFLDANNFFNNAAFGTFSVNGADPGVYGIGVTYSNTINSFGFEGWIAAVYVWEKALSAAEQTALDSYTLSKWGV